MVDGVSSVRASETSSPLAHVRVAARESHRRNARSSSSSGSRMRRRNRRPVPLAKSSLWRRFGEGPGPGRFVVEEEVGSRGGGRGPSRVVGVGALGVGVT